MTLTQKITLHDMTLRDGMHPKRHLMTLEQMTSIACGLDAAGIPLIEVTKSAIADIFTSNLYWCRQTQKIPVTNIIETIAARAMLK